MVMKPVVLVIGVMMWFASPVYADQYSNEPENAPNKADSTDESEEESEGDDFYNYGKE